MAGLAEKILEKRKAALGALVPELAELKQEIPADPLEEAIGDVPDLDAAAIRRERLKKVFASR